MLLLLLLLLYPSYLPFTMKKSTKMAVVLTVVEAAMAVLLVRRKRRRNKFKIDHRQQPRSNRRNFRHDEALSAIRRDYLGVLGDPTTPLFGADFKLMFRLSRGRFEVLLQDVMASNFELFKSTPQDGISKASLEARLLLPLKTLAYGVPAHTFCDYFQISKQFASDLCKGFDKLIIALYLKEFLRLPSSTDLKKTLQLHRSVDKGNNSSSDNLYQGGI